jgi:protein SCO1/2
MSCSARQQSFQKAISQAREAKMDEVNPVKSGVPFYSIKTLDPNWEEFGKTPIVRIPELTLVGQDGKTRSESLFNGKITFVAFFFTSCAGFCPVFLKHLQEVENRLKAVQGIQYVAISVDPETDQPDRLRKYFKKMNFNSKTWTLLTGNRELIYTLARETFASEAFRLPKSSTQIAHSEHFYVIDPKRRLRGTLKGTRLDVAEGAHQLISELMTDLGS